MDVEVAIVGSGFSGLGTAVRLREDGIRDLVILERADDLGGTWRDNSYPGATCDVPSQLYSLDFLPNPSWSRSFSRQPEILEYLRWCAESHGLLPYLRLGHEVLSASWDEPTGRWVVETSKGTVRAQFVVDATGPLSEPKLPDIPGLDSFAGTVFHSAQWRHDHDLTGERVAVIGTGASAAQFVPEIQPEVGRLMLFQRTPPWVIPRKDRKLAAWEHKLYRKVPALQRMIRTGIYLGRELYAVGFTVDQRVLAVATRAAKRHLERSVADPELRRKLTPSYTIGCKRIILSNDYYPALTRPNAEVVTDSIVEVRPHSIVTADGTERPVDTIVCATGFHVTDPPFAERVHGRAGATLAEEWRTGLHSYLGTTISGFPNYFRLLGPNTGAGHTSVVLFSEAQLEHVRDAVRFARDHHVVALDVRRDVMRRDTEAVQRRMRHTVWVNGGCQSWYLDEHGNNTTLWPSFVASFRKKTARFDRYAYAIDARPRGVT